MSRIRSALPRLRRSPESRKLLELPDLETLAINLNTGPGLAELRPGELIAVQTPTPIRARDEWYIPRPVEQVWRVLADLAAYPRWWPRGLRLRVLACVPGLIGSELEVRPVGGRPFRCRVETVEENRRMRMTYFGGFIAGSGEWQLDAEGAGTRVRYVLDVTAEGRLVAWLSRIMSLGNLHSRQMRDVLRQLERTACRRS